jgi:tetratricopeptide (TPR) repeat protein
MKKNLLLLIIICSATGAFSQGIMKTRKWRKTELASLSKAQAMFEEENFVMALPLYERIMQNHPKETYLKYVTGICGLYRSDYHERSLELLQQVYEKNKKAADIEYDLARAYHYNYKFDEALALLDKYLRRKNTTPDKKKAAEQLVSYCNNAKILVASPVDAQIENIGEIVNTVNSEYVPVISSDEQVMIYTYRGDESTGGKQNAFNQPDEFGIYYEDVFITHKEGDKWATAGSIGANINTNAHDAAIGISNDGQKLFIFRDNGYDGGDIYMSVLDGSSWSAPEKLRGDVNTSAWEGSASLSADEKTLYFSSEWPGGYGGKDLYMASLMPDGSWGKIKNLGATVNTASDDDAPFIHPDGVTMLYSSKGLNSMGGYDIFRTELSPKDSTWSTPVNMGYPINTPDEDIYFVLAANGTRGYYASGKSGGFGLQDIYSVDVSKVVKAPPVFMLNGITTMDEKPVAAQIKIEVADKNSVYRDFASNSATGSYLVNLPPGANYTVTYSLKDFPSQTIRVEALDLPSYIEKKVNINFSIPKDTVPKTDSIPAVKADTTARKPTIGEVVDKVGNSTKEGLEFKVQIAAYNLPKNYNYDYLKGLGKVEKLQLEDGITRFTIGGSFKTLNEAIAHKDKVRAAGQKDAFVTAIYQGKRVYLEELEKLGLIPAQPK